MNHRTARPSRRVLPALCAGLLLAAAGAQAAGDAAATAPAVAPAPAARTISQDAFVRERAARPADVFVLDVRSPQEFAEGHIPGAVNVPYDQLGARLAEVPKSKDVVLYCRSGRRAGIAADLLAANGYARLALLEGDMPAWQAQGRPVEKP